MDIRYSPQHRALQEDARSFIKEYGHLSPRTGGGRKRRTRGPWIGRNFCWSEAILLATFPANMAALACRSDIMELAIIADEFSDAGVSPGIMNQGISMLAPTLLEIGTKEQCARWIGPTIRGDIIWCQGYSEPGSGSDLAAAKTSARIEDGHFVINGQKIWTSSAHYADMMFLLCRTEFDKSNTMGCLIFLFP